MLREENKVLLFANVVFNVYTGVFVLYRAISVTGNRFVCCVRGLPIRKAKDRVLFSIAKKAPKRETLSARR